MTRFSFHGRSLSPQTMVGLGRAAMPQFGAGRGRALLPSFPPVHVKPASTESEPQPASHVKLSETGRESLKTLSILSYYKLQMKSEKVDILGRNGFC